MRILHDARKITFVKTEKLLVLKLLVRYFCFSFFTKKILRRARSGSVPYDYLYSFLSGGIYHFLFLIRDDLISLIQKLPVNPHPIALALLSPQSASSFFPVLNYYRKLFLLFWKQVAELFFIASIGNRCDSFAYSPLFFLIRVYCTLKNH